METEGSIYLPLCTEGGSMMDFFFMLGVVKGIHLGVSGDSDLKKAERDVLCSELWFHEQNSMALFSVQSLTVRKSWVMLADGNQRAQVKDEQECHP